MSPHGPQIDPKSIVPPQDATGGVLPRGGSGTPHTTLVIVGHCPACGNPLYGRERLMSDEQPVVVRSCGCIPLGALMG